jgi:hypothetical protein
VGLLFYHLGDRGLKDFGMSSGRLRGGFGEASGRLRGGFGEASGRLRGGFGEASGRLRGGFGKTPATCHDTSMKRDRWDMTVVWDRGDKSTEVIRLLGN